MLDHIVTATVSRRPVASVLALIALSIVATVALTACDAAAEHRSTGTMQPRPLMSAPAEAASVPQPSQGGAALQTWRDDVDPSHAAIGSYRD